MSIRNRGPDAQGRPRHQVQWREGGRQRSRTFTGRGAKKHAEAFDLEVKQRKQLGPLAGTVMVSRITLAEFVHDEWWPRYAIPNLAADTRRRYLEVWGHDLLPRVGGYALREITPLLVEDLRDQLEKQGLSPASRRKSLLLLSGILKRAVVRGLIPVNPVSMIDMPKTPAAARPVPLSPATVERIRQHILTEAWTTTKRGAGRSSEDLRRWRQSNALIISMMAYGGLRPIEDRGARWDDLQDRTLHVLASKTGRARDVDLLAPLAQDLAEWRMACGRPAGDALILPRPSGGEWTRGDWSNWRRRVYRPAAIAAGVTGDLRPYRLRGSFVSLLLWSGMDLVEVAEQAGHSVATLAKHYAGVMKDLKGQPRVPAAEAIRQARETASGQLTLAGVKR